MNFNRWKYRKLLPTLWLLASLIIPTIADATPSTEYRTALFAAG